MSAAAAITPFERRAARLVGALYLATMATSIAGYALRSRLLVRGDAVRSAENILASEGLFRLGTVLDLVTLVGVVVLLWGLYVVLAPVHRHLAFLAAFLRLTECAVAAAAVAGPFVGLRLLTRGDGGGAFQPEQLQVLARALIGAQAVGLEIAFVFLGAGSALFSLLWLRSRRVPRPLAAWGIFASLTLAGVGLAIMLFPALGRLGLLYMAPMFVYEVGLGAWLLVRPLRATVPAA